VSVLLFVFIVKLRDLTLDALPAKQVVIFLIITIEPNYQTELYKVMGSAVVLRVMCPC